MRALGFQNVGLTPKRDWRRQNVCLVSNESDLVSFSAGPRGSGGGAQPIVAAEFSCFVVTAGPAGVRVSFPAGIAGRYGYFAASPTVTAPTVLPITWTDPNRQGSSRLVRGSFAAEPTVNAPTFAAASLHYVDRVWVAPLQVFAMWRSAAAQALDGAFLFQEP